MNRAEDMTEDFSYGRQSGGEALAQNGVEALLGSTARLVWLLKRRTAWFEVLPLPS